MGGRVLVMAIGGAWRKGLDGKHLNQRIRELAALMYRVDGTVTQYCRCHVGFCAVADHPSLLVSLVGQKNKFG